MKTYAQNGTYFIIFRAALSSDGLILPDSIAPRM